MAVFEGREAIPRYFYGLPVLVEDGPDIPIEYSFGECPPAYARNAGPVFAKLPHFVLVGVLQLEVMGQELAG